MDYLPTTGRPQWVVAEELTDAVITYTDRQTGTVVWSQSFNTYDPIPSPPRDLPHRDYTVQMTWREDWQLP